MRKLVDKTINNVSLYCEEANVNMTKGLRFFKSRERISWDLQPRYNSSVYNPFSRWNCTKAFRSWFYTQIQRSKINYYKVHVRQFEKSIAQYFVHNRIFFSIFSNGHDFLSPVCAHKLIQHGHTFDIFFSFVKYEKKKFFDSRKLMSWLIFENIDHFRRYGC